MISTSGSVLPADERKANASLVGINAKHESTWKALRNQWKVALFSNVTRMV